MVTKTIDVDLPAELEQYLSKPVCIPLPQPSKVEINLPMGGTLQGLADITKGIPDDCTLSFSLALPLGAFLANLDCLMKIVKVIEPLVTVVTALAKPDPFAAAEAAKKLPEAVGPLLECISKFFGTGVPLFVRDLLCLVIKILGCVIAQLKIIVNVIGGLALQIEVAQGAGNAELLASLECAQQNAQVSAQHMMTAVEPVMLLLSLAEPLLSLAGVGPIESPALASPDDLEKMQQAIGSLEDLVETLKLAAEVVGGC
jgi:hypothetical protein